jgi:hypothetical protein
MSNDKPYSTMRETTTVLTKEKFVCEDFSRIELETIDNLGKLYRILKEIARGSGDYGDMS